MANSQFPVSEQMADATTERIKQYQLFSEVNFKPIFPEASKHSVLNPNWETRELRKKAILAWFGLLDKPSWREKMQKRNLI